MARRPKPAKTFQQRQTEKRKREDLEEQDRAIVEDTAARFTCSNQLAADFAQQCENRIEELDYDLALSELAASLWAASPHATQPVVAVLADIEAERRRYQAALLELRARLLPLTGEHGPHYHLPVDRAHAQRVVRDKLLPNVTSRPVEISATPGAC